MKTIAFNYTETVQTDFYIRKFEDLLDLPILSVIENQEMGVGQ